MSFFDDASLAFLPSGAAGKDGKAYSIKPTDGTGDFTFSRGSNLAATRVGADGLIEKGRENLLLQSNNFDTTPWGAPGSDVTIGQIGYDGSNNAWLFSKTDTNGRVQQNISTSGVNTFSVYAKAGTKNWMALRVDGSGVNTYFDLQNGVLGSSPNTIAANIESVGNGWYRCSVSFSSAITRVRIYVGDANNDTSGTSGSIYIQDSQLEIGLAATEVIESGATTGKAGLLEDEPRFDYSGGATCPNLLLEPSRTQLLGYSEYFETYYTKQAVSTTTNVSTSPEGLQNASKLIPANGTGGNRSLGKSFTGLSGIHTFSTFAKAGEYGYVSLRLRNTPSAFVMFDLNDGSIHNENDNAQYVTGSAKIEDYGNGWYRCSASFDPSGSGSVGDLFLSLSVGITGDESGQWNGDGVSGIYIYGMQFESGSYPTSYIPNHSGGTITRGAEDVDLTGVSSLIGQNEGSYFVEFQAKRLDEVYSMFSINDGTNNNRIQLTFTDSGTNPRIGFFYFVNGVNGFQSSSIQNLVANQTYKFAVTYTQSSLSAYLDGTQIINETGLSLSGGTFNEIAYGLRASSSSFPFNMPVKQTLVFDTPLSNADLATLTTI
jgi:hypothetical protein